MMPPQAKLLFVRQFHAFLTKNFLKPGHSRCNNDNDIMGISEILSGKINRYE